MNDKQKQAIISNLDSLLFDLGDKVQNKLSGNHFKIIGITLNVGLTDLMYITIEKNAPANEFHYISRAFMDENFKVVKWVLKKTSK